jgi:hypothetical protein
LLGTSVTALKVRNKKSKEKKYHFLMERRLEGVLVLH